MNSNNSRRSDSNFEKKSNPHVIHCTFELFTIELPLHGMHFGIEYRKCLLHIKRIDEPSQDAFEYLHSVLRSVQRAHSKQTYASASATESINKGSN